MLAFIVALCWWDTASLRSSSSPWWTAPVFFATITGFLVGYDTYERLRRDGSLRLMLLHSTPRLQFALGFIAAGTLIAGVGTTAILGYLVVTGRVGASLAFFQIVLLLWLGIAGFVAYAHIMSLLIPRDAAALLGVIAIVFGLGPYDRWLPSGTPVIVDHLLNAVWSSIPTSARLSAITGQHDILWNASVLVVQCAAGVCVIWALLSRRTLLARVSSPA